MRRQLISGLRMLLILSVVTGVVYPLAVTFVAQVAFRSRAEGSLVTEGGRVVGSRLIGQSFAGAGWFHPRPDVFDPGASGPSNLGPSNPALAASVRERLEALRREDGVTTQVPADAVTRSASGLDPDISVAYALLQVDRVAAARGLTVDELRRLVASQTTPRTLGFLGEPRVNVLALDLALERLASGS